MKIARTCLALAAAALLALPLAGCSDGKAAAADSASDTYYIFDTVVNVKVYDPGMTQDRFDEIGRLLQRIDTEMNRAKNDSEIGKVNQAAGKGGAIVSEETYRVVKTAMDFAARTDGRFDPTIGPLVDLWGIGSDHAKVPDPASLAAALKLVDYKDATLDDATRRIALHRPGMSIDLGAIAKGYAADVIADYLKGQGFRNAIIDLGGNVLAMGARPDGSDWRIGVQDPGRKRGSPLGLLELKDKTVVTSGIYERFFEENGAAYHHILDTRTGYPVDQNLLSVTIVTDVSMNADAMSTSVFALGLDAGRAYVESRGDAEAIFVTKDKKIYVTSGLRDKFQLTHYDYAMGE